MALAVDSGTVHFANLLDKNDDLLFNTFYIEAVKDKKKKDRILFNTTEVITDDIILKFCPYCGKCLTK